MDDSNRKKMIAQTFIFRLGIPRDVAAGKAPQGYDQKIFQATYNYLGNKSENNTQALSNLLQWPKEAINKNLEETQRFVNTFTNKEKEFLGQKGIFNVTKGAEAFSLLNKLDKITRGELQQVESEIERKWVRARALMGKSVGSRNRLLLNYRSIKKLNTPPPRPVPVPQSVNKSVFKGKHTPLHLSMYNGTLPKNEPNETLNLTQMLRLNGQSIFKDKKYGEFTVKVTEITGRSKIKFQKIWQISSETQNMNKLINGSADASTGSITFKARVTKGETEVGASLTLHMSGAIRISGGFIDVNLNKSNTNSNLDPATVQTMLLKNHIFDSYIINRNNLRNKPVNFNNISGNFNINYAILSMEESAIKSGVFYEPELSVQLKIPLSTGTTMNVSASGKIQLTGIKGMNSVLPSFREALDKLNNLVLRNEELPNFKNYKPKRTSKFARRANNLPAPNITRRGSTCPKSARPIPLSFQGKCQPRMYRGKMINASEFYVRPNPQGQPCCYRKPKNTTYIKNRVANRYRQANVKVPNNVGNLFNVSKPKPKPNSNSNSNSNVDSPNKNVATKAPNITIVNGPRGLKIGSRQCMRYTRVRLFEIATLLKVKNLKITDGKEALCDKIKQKSKELGLNKTKNVVGNSAITITNNNGKVYAITGKGKNIRLGNRVCTTFSKPFLIKMAGKMDLAVNVSKMSKIQICAAIEQAKNLNRGRRNNLEKQKLNQLDRNKQERLLRMRQRNERLRLQKQGRQLEEQQRTNREVRNKLGLNKNAIRAEISKLFGVVFMKKYGNKINLNEQTNLLFQNLNSSIKNGRIEKGTRGNPLKTKIIKFKREWIIRKRNSIKPKVNKPPTPAVFNPLNDMRRHLGNERFNRIKNSLTPEMLQNYVNFIYPNPNANKRNTWIRTRKSFGLLPTTPVVGIGFNNENVEEI